ncbi:MAG: hypothetical protein RJQ10_03490 [Haliea sp.]|uniref:hypothetical protein n=1 Tax=Haliea sp. TaxID=1932666 RepID=UPI0032EF51C4
MTSAASLWQPCAADDLVTHRFPEGVAVFSARDKSTAYLPDPAGEVFALLLREPHGLAGTEILQHLAATATPGKECSAVSLEELQAVLLALEQQLLIRTSG